MLATARLLVQGGSLRLPVVPDEAAWHAVVDGPRLGPWGDRRRSPTTPSCGSRGVFREHGHTATTREVSQAAGISEAILYQRFGSKDALFFAAMHAQGPEIEALLGPEDPPDDALRVPQDRAPSARDYFAEVIPLALRVMTHPSFDPASLSRSTPGGPAELRDGLAKRLASLAEADRLAAADPVILARLLLSLCMTGARDRLRPRAAADERPQARGVRRHPVGRVAAPRDVSGVGSHWRASYRCHPRGDGCLIEGLVYETWGF